ncbi:MAG TPA: hypothetical protein VKL99_06545 [Candidatus Angelobacter sp.]|nr:hypothetical protein [Candidatus Angelobacter sp.]
MALTADSMLPLHPLIPGFYADDSGQVYLNMREFLSAHGMPDVPRFRAVVWDEVEEIFAMEVIEIFD